MAGSVAHVAETLLERRPRGRAPGLSSFSPVSIHFQAVKLATCTNGVFLLSCVELLRCSLSRTGRVLPSHCSVGGPSEGRGREGQKGKSEGGDGGREG